MFAHSINEDEKAVLSAIQDQAEEVDSFFNKLEEGLIAIFMGLDSGPPLDAEGMQVLRRVEDSLTLLKITQGLWHEGYVKGLEP